mgnify:CR=1 FL=1
MYKILIIEDDLVMAGAIKKEMEAWGNEARYVEDFAKVLETFAEYGPHLVLLDITLPFYNGYHWCSEIRKISSVPVIFISSAADNMNIIMAMNMGGDDFIAKPFDLNVKHRILIQFYALCPSQILCQLMFVFFFYLQKILQ